MRTRKIEASLDRRIITGMVVSTEYLKMLVPIYTANLLKAPFAVTVANWCLTYFEKYEKAPGKHIQDIFQEKQKVLEPAQSDLIETFLANLSDEYEHSEKFNVDYLYDQTELLFRTRNLQQLASTIEDNIQNGAIEDAERNLTTYRKIERPRADGINPLHDRDAFRKGFMAVEEPLFKLPGALGKMLNSHLIREGLVAFLGRAKIGKTWMLKLLAQHGLKSHCNVAFFQMGDLSQDNFMVRLGIMMAKKSHDRRYCGEIFVPVLDCEKNQLNECTVSCEAYVRENGQLLENWKELCLSDKYTPCSQCRKTDKDFKGAVWYKVRKPVQPLEWRDAWKAVELWKRRYRSHGFRLVSYSSGTANTKDIVRQLDMWEQQDFVPDVIIIDYADIMAPETNQYGEFRHSENAKWMALRKLSQDRRCLVLTVTQANRFGASEESLTTENTSEDKRKYDHTTAFFALNQTTKEKEEKVLRVAELLVREGGFNTNKQVAVLQSLETGQPYINSYWWTKPDKPKKKEKAE